MRSVNRIIIVGTMGELPQVRVTNRGHRVATFPVATTRRWSTSDGQQHEKTEWHRCVAWNGTGPKFADVVERLGRKGLSVYVEGRLEYRNYDLAGEQKWVTELIVQEFVALENGTQEMPATPAVAPPIAEPADTA